MGNIVNGATEPSKCGTAGMQLARSGQRPAASICHPSLRSHSRSLQRLRVIQYFRLSLRAQYGDLHRAPEIVIGQASVSLNGCNNLESGKFFVFVLCSGYVEVDY